MTIPGSPSTPPAVDGDDEAADTDTSTASPPSSVASSSLSLSTPHYSRPISIPLRGSPTSPQPSDVDSPLSHRSRDSDSDEAHAASEFSVSLPHPSSPSLSVPLSTIPTVELSSDSTAPAVPTAVDERSSTAVAVPPAAAVACVPGESVASFTLLNVIGRGGYGTVFLCQHRVSGRLYAMKVLTKAVVQAKRISEGARQEKLILALIHHPFLVTLRYAFQSATKLYLVMDYVAGGELFNRLDQQPGRRLPERDVQFYAAEVVLALEYLHARDIIYRDLKPENVLLDRKGHVVLSDFGFAKSAVRGARDANSFLGTAHAMSPEMIDGSGHGKGTDWWALGVLVCELLTGKPPWHGNNRAALQEAILSGPLHLPKHLTTHARHLIQSLLKRPLDKRLGCGGDGADSVKRHPFFHGVNWERLAARRVKAPWVPPLSGERDVSMFDPQFTSERVCESPSSLRRRPHTDGAHEDAAERERVRGFEGFSFTRSPHFAFDRSQELGPVVGSVSTFLLSSPSTTPSHHSLIPVTSLTLGESASGAAATEAAVSKKLLAQRTKEKELDAEEQRLQEEREQEREKARAKDSKKARARREKADKLREENAEEYRLRAEREADFQQRQQREQDDIQRRTMEEQSRKAAAAAASTPTRPISQLSQQLAAHRQPAPAQLPAAVLSSSGVKLAPWARVAAGLPTVPPSTPPTSAAAAVMTPSSASTASSASSRELTPSIPITARLFPALDSATTPPQQRGSRGSVGSSTALTGSASAGRPPGATDIVSAARTPASASKGGKTTWSRLLF